MTNLIDTINNNLIKCRGSIRGFIILCLFFYLCFTPYSYAAVPKDVITGHKYFSSGEFKKAYKIYETIYISDPDNVDALVGMAFCRLNMGQIKKAKAMFIGVLRYEPDNPGAIEGLAKANEAVYKSLNNAWAKYFNKDYKGARNDFIDIEEDDQRLLPNAELWRLKLGIGFTYYEENNLTEAKTNFENVNKVQPNAMSYKGLGLVEFKKTNYLSALDLFTQSLLYSPGQNDVLSFSALCMVHLEKDETASSMFEHLIEKTPWHLSNDDFYNAIKDKPMLQPLFSKLGWALFHKHLFAKSLEVFEAGLGQNDSDPDLLRGAGYASFSLKNYEKAADFSSLSIELMPQLEPILETVYTPGNIPYQFSSDAKTTLAWSLYHLNNFEKATTLFESAVKLHPDWPDPLSGLGWINFAQKKYDNAKQMFQRAIEIDPEYLDAHSGIAAIEKINAE